ncbi:transcriptional regulator, LacI family [Geodermatophilus telluris]|uniref:Transcriptional regulator, LacI family n=1 Tax=Geodermatophilus telluris TaxID=1190417 RepID=A0A1G6QM93_9ACTN|nr:LacI family DNA-binding transcriptional regulator [Geodermatophilus telluris]SDC92817.1 transcriptional regulator, LacI family [Geodermatophilus telluris]
MDRPAAQVPPTIAEVARAAGVAKATAGRVLGGYGSPSPELQARVRAAAEALGYRPNMLARSMSTGVTKTIGVVVADISNPFFAGLVRGIADAGRAAGYDTVLVNTDERVDRERAAVEVLVGKQVDGLIIASAAGAPAPAPHLRAAISRGTPVVGVDRDLPDLDADVFVIDNREITRHAVDHLIDAGHRRIAYAWGPPHPGQVRSREELLGAAGADLSTGAARLRGYVDALDAAGIDLDPRLVTTGVETVEGTEEALRVMLGSARPPSAVFATETDALLGALRALQAAGLRCPEDVSLVGFDDSPWTAVVEPPITVVQQPVQQLGEAAARRLIQRIDGFDAAAERTVLSARLVSRSSVRGPRTQPA